MTNENNSIIIKALDVYYSYPDEDNNPDNAVNALSGLSAEIPRGKFTAVIGHNGPQEHACQASFGYFASGQRNGDCIQSRL